MCQLALGSSRLCWTFALVLGVASLGLATAIAVGVLAAMAAVATVLMDWMDMYTIGTVCLLYGGPLEEGQLVDSTLQCPWHYSRFAIKDGAVAAGPATAPVPAYDVRIKNDQIQVKARNVQS